MMNIIDIIIISLMGYTVVAAVGTLVTYLLFVLFDMGSSELSTIFFMCAISGAGCLMFVGILIFMDAPGINKEEG